VLPITHDIDAVYMQCSTLLNSQARTLITYNQTAILQVLSDSIQTVDGDAAVLALLDLSVAFDAVEYGIPLQYLQSSSYVLIAMHIDGVDRIYLVNPGCTMRIRAVILYNCTLPCSSKIC